MQSHMQSIAESVGLTMRPRDVIINSRRALGAAEFARQHDAFEAMHHALFKAHWEGSGKLEDMDDLVRIGADIGLDAGDLRASIEEDRYASVIDENRQAAGSVGIDAIPAHIFGRRYLILGAQPRQVFQQVLERLLSDE
jgi:predicted DsbA family dithiol-disulfide isomerase